MKNMKSVAKAVLRLFKSLPSANEITSSTAKAVNEFNTIGVKYGLFAPANADLTWAAEKDIVEICKKYGSSLEEMNQTFHKSLRKVATASDEQLFFEQIMHYMTTYGVESLGFKTGELCPVFIPAEKLELPQDSEVKILVFKTMSEKEIKENVIALSQKNVAYSTGTLGDIVTLAKAYNIELNADDIQNKELKIMVCSELGTVPKNPQSFLRLLFYTVMDNSLMVKNEENLRKLYNSGAYHMANKFLEIYIKKYGYAPLASIFYQHKKLWLVMKNSGNASIINKIRRLADKYKKPAQKGVLDRITSDATVSLDAIEKELEKVSLGKKVSLYNALSFRQAEPEATTYRIRNGKLYYKMLESVPEIFKNGKAKKIFDLLRKSIAKEVENKVKGKVVYIPDTVSYVFPTSEKDFIGGIPCGSVAHLGETATIGIHWENLPHERVDLDFHCKTVSQSFGWNSSYRSKDRAVLFTGDMTDAPIEEGGATECFYLGEKAKEDYMFDICFYNAWCNFADDIFPFKYKLILDASPKKVFDRQYILDNKTVLTTVEMEMQNANQKIGFVSSNENGLKDFMFCNLEAGTGCVPNNDPETKKMLIESLVLQYKTRLSLADVLAEAGAVVVNTRPDDGEFVDLSFEQISPTSIVSLVF